MGRTVRSIAGIVSIAATFLALGYGVFTVAREQDIPDRLFWTTGPGAIFQFPVTVVGLIAVAWVALESKTLRWLIRRDRNLEALEENLQALVLNFYESDRAGLPYDKLAAHVWRTRKRYWITGEDVLVRLVTYKPDGKVPASGIAWAKGKGVVGRAWDEMNPFTMNLADLHDAFDKGRFDTLSDEEKLGLTAAEFRRTKHYWAVYVAPLRNEDSGELRGVATVAVLQPNCYQALRRAANQPAVDSPVTAIEDIVVGM